jgi:CRISPR-associated endonuclease/helicase Cas3
MELYDYQDDIAKAIADGKSIILQAPTGAGKTLASLYPYFEAWADNDPSFPKKCIYSVPMRVLANQFYDEYDKLVSEKLNAAKVPKVSRQTGEYREDSEFQSDLIFATIDQVLSNWLMHPYSLSKRKGNINAGALVGSYLIFDEFHLFDPDSTMPTTLHMLKMLKGVSPFILMTATFSADMLQDLAQQLDAVPFLLTPKQLKDIAAQDKTRRFHTTQQPLVTSESADVARIVELHINQPINHQRSLVVCNQVERAQRVYSTLKQHPHLPADVEVILLHSRFLKQDRQQIEALVRREFHHDKTKRTLKSVILIGTQTVEVGLDMSSSVLHTEIAPAAAVLQRAGRCARYQGEVGDVFVYPVADEKYAYAPYHEKEAKSQCLLTWEWLENNQNRHLDFAAEQALINHAHTPTDKHILEGLAGADFQHKEDIEHIWRGGGNQADASRLIREIQSVSVIVHDDPDQFAIAPFQAESFSLYPGTLKGKLKKWSEKNGELAPDFDEGAVPWVAQYLTELEDEEDAQGNRPNRYQFVPVKHTSQLHAPLVVVHPSFVDYSEKLGLTFNGGGQFRTDPPSKTSGKKWETYRYRLESYEEHIRLVYQAFEQDSLTTVERAGNRIEKRFGWPKGCVAHMAKLVVALHDVGKLSQGWQGWAKEWQASTEINNPIGSNMAAAHTDYDPAIQAQADLNRKLRGKRPHHAVESAVASLKFLMIQSPTQKRDHPLVRAAFTAIARHHAPFSSESQSFELATNFETHIAQSFAEVGLPEINPKSFIPKFVGSDDQQKLIEKDCLAKPNHIEDMLCYMLFARALRLADQKGTAEGSK